jgi:hypothetical protein
MASASAYLRLRLDIWSIKALVSLLGLDGELLDSHLFFYVRYSELADYHRSNGRLAKAEKLEAIAEAHYRAAPGDDDEPPEAAAAAMPVPQPPMMTNAVSTKRVKNATRPPADLVPSTAS